MRLQGLNITVTIQRRQQQSDDDIGGSVQTTQTVRSGVPARIGGTRSPMQLRAQGIEVQNVFDCVMRSPDYDDLDIRIDDIVFADSGQHRGQVFAVTAVQEDSVADSPGDYRRHKFVSLRRWERARQVQ